MAALYSAFQLIAQPIHEKLNAQAERAIWFLISLFPLYRGIFDLDEILYTSGDRRSRISI
jgi:outer membrane phospholipase A